MANKLITKKKFGFWEVGMIKWSTAAWVLFLITVWPGLHDLVFKVHWGIWLALGIIFMWKPMMKYFGK